MDAPKKILIAVPTYENILPDTFKSIYGLQKPTGFIVMFDFVRGYHCARARNLIADEAINYGFDYVLMVDSDMLIPSNALTSMLKDHVDVCLGCYPRKNTHNGTLELFKLGQKDFVKTYSYDEIKAQGGKIDVKGGGFGCALIRVEAMKQITKPYFKYVEYDSGDVLSEDNYFCGQMARAGFKIQADTDVMCGHSIRGFQWR